MIFRKKPKVYHPNEKQRKSHRRQKFFVILALVTFTTMQAQLDHWCAPSVYDNTHYLPIAFGFGMMNTLAYDIAIFFQYVAIGILLTALWFWD